jgi:hypothetical protein
LQAVSEREEQGGVSKSIVVQLFNSSAQWHPAYALQEARERKVQRGHVKEWSTHFCVAVHGTQEVFADGQSEIL